MLLEIAKSQNGKGLGEVPKNFATRKSRVYI